jgi:hypothetical protein
MFDPRAVLEMAVDDATYAGDREVQYRPHKSPANLYFDGLAGDAGGILRDLVRDIVVRLPLRLPTSRPGCPQSRLKRR